MGEVNDGSLKDHVLKADDCALVLIVKVEREVDDLAWVNFLSGGVPYIPVLLAISAYYDSSRKVGSVSLANGRVDKGKRVYFGWQFSVVAEPGLLKGLKAFGDDFVLVLVCEHVGAKDFFLLGQKIRAQSFWEKEAAVVLDSLFVNNAPFRH